MGWHGARDSVNGNGYTLHPARRKPGTSLWNPARGAQLRGWLVQLPGRLSQLSALSSQLLGCCRVAASGEEEGGTLVAGIKHKTQAHKHFNPKPVYKAPNW
jgi:hypothetical protein